MPDPAGEIPLDTAAEVIDEALAKAEISVHLLGEKAGEAPEDQPPMVKLQLQRAAKKAAEDGTAKFHRLVWAPGVWTIPATAKQEATELEHAEPEIYDLLRRGLGYLEREQATLRAIVFFEAQLAKVLGIHMEKQSESSRQLMESLTRAPEARLALMKQLGA